MAERFIVNSKNGMGFRVGQGERPVERFRFAPQADTLKSFLAGKGRPEDNRLTLSVNNRTEIWHRHNPGFADGQVKVVSVGAHPDDTALDTGLAHLLVKKGQ